MLHVRRQPHAEVITQARHDGHAHKATAAVLIAMGQQHDAPAAHLKVARTVRLLVHGQAELIGPRAQRLATERVRQVIVRKGRRNGAR